MDSWSRPNKHAATPPPLYLTVGDAVPYCHSCGRVISERRKTHGNSEVKYCSARCRNNKPGSIDRKIEATFAALLEGASPEQFQAQNAQDEEGNERDTKNTDNKDAKHHKKKPSKSIKGDHRPIIECQTVQDIVFPHEKDPEKIYGRRKNRKPRFVVEKPEDWRSVDMVDYPVQPPCTTSTSATPQTQDITTSDSEDSFSDSDSPSASGGIALEPTDLPDTIELGNTYGYGSGKVRPPQSQNDVNGSVGGEKGWAERIDETDDMKAKRREGQKRADEREMVRRAARRGCAFGFVVEVREDDAAVTGKGKKNGKSKAAKTDDEEESKKGEERKKCEAVMKGVVVEPSFAKGEWGIRWREKI